MFYLCNFKVQRIKQSRNMVYRCHFRKEGGDFRENMYFYSLKLKTSKAHLEIKKKTSFWGPFLASLIEVL